MYTILAVVLGVLSLFLHEMGHFFAMRQCGVRIHEVGLGMPMNVFTLSWKWKNISWRISPVLLGAYVQPADDNYEESLTLRPRLYLFGNGIVANLACAFLLIGLSNKIAGADVWSKWCAPFGLLGVCVIIFRRYICYAMPLLSVGSLIVLAKYLFTTSAAKMIADGSGGPVAVYSALVGPQGIADTLFKVAMFNLTLATFNLLPLSILDGGRAVRAILTRVVGSRTEKAFSAVTATALVLLVGYMFGLDFLRIFGWLS